MKTIYIYIFLTVVLIPGAFVILWRDLTEYEKENHSKDPIFKLRVKQLRLIGMVIFELLALFFLLKEFLDPSDW